MSGPLVPCFEDSKCVCEILCQRPARVQLHCRICSIFAAVRDIHLIPDSSWDNAIVVRFSGSFCQEQENNLTKSPRTLQSQQADITAREPDDALNAVRMPIRPLSWSLTGITRVCRNSPMAEIYMLSNVVEQGLQTGAVVFDVKGQPNVHPMHDLSDLKQPT